MNSQDRNFIATLVQVTALVVSLLLAGFAGVAESQDMQMSQPSANANAAQAGNDSGLAYLSGLQASQYSRVGRLAVQLIRDGAMQQVPFDWVFHTNDEFRFMIASNRDGWLYILHKSPGGQLQLLYPPTDPNTGQASSNSRVTKNEYFLVPQPMEGSFVFETDTGAETFFLVIKDRPEPPALSDIIPDQTSSQQQNVPGSQNQQQYQAPAAVPVEQYQSQPQSAGAPQYQQQYQQAPPAGQYPPQQQGAWGSQTQQQYQAQPAAADQFSLQPQNAPGTQYQQQYQAQATAPGNQYPPQTRHEVRQQLQEVALDTLNYSVIPKAVRKLAGTKKLTGQRYRGVRFKPASQGNDPGTYFAPQPVSELQDAWFVFKLNHVD